MSLPLNFFPGFQPPSFGLNPHLKELRPNSIRIRKPYAPKEPCYFFSTSLRVLFFQGTTIHPPPKRMPIFFSRLSNVTPEPFCSLPLMPSPPDLVPPSTPRFPTFDLPLFLFLILDELWERLFRGCFCNPFPTCPRFAIGGS